MIPGIVVTDAATPKFMDALNKATHDWTMRAARGECGWICSSCCGSSDSGMPDECFYGDKTCNDIIKRDKLQASQESK